MRKQICLVIFVAIMVFSCKKGSNNGCFVGLKLAANDSIPYAGDSLIIYANQIGLTYNWSGPANFTYQSTSGENSITIAPVQIRQSGWYYCTASEVDCDTDTDSIYIRVQYDQGSPSCSLVDEQISSTAGLPDVNAVSVFKSYSGSYNAVTMTVYGGIGYPEYNFVFNSYNGNTEPQDGIYYVNITPSYEQSQDADLINMNCTWETYYFSSSQAGQKMYVSHVNEKLRIAFCDIQAGDESGVNGKFTGQVTEQ